jgi:hypothetical protein
MPNWGATMTQSAEAYARAGVAAPVLHGCAPTSRVRTHAPPTRGAPQGLLTGILTGSPRGLASMPTPPASTSLTSGKLAGDLG